MGSTLWVFELVLGLSFASFNGEFYSVTKYYLFLEKPHWIPKLDKLSLLFGKVTLPLLAFSSVRSGTLFWDVVYFWVDLLGVVLLFRWLVEMIADLFFLALLSSTSHFIPVKFLFLWARHWEHLLMEKFVFTTLCDVHYINLLTPEPHCTDTDNQTLDRFCSKRTKKGDDPQTQGFMTLGESFLCFSFTQCMKWLMVTLL